MELPSRSLWFQHNRGLFQRLNGLGKGIFGGEMRVDTLMGQVDSLLEFSPHGSMFLQRKLS